MSVVRFYEWCLCEIDNVFSMSIFNVRFKQSLENPQWFTQILVVVAFVVFELFWHLCKIATSTKHPFFVPENPPH